MLNSALNQSTLRNGAIALVLVASLSACMVGPDYRRPEVDVPAAWRLGATEAVEIANIAWWDQFQDPVLSELVRTALANNKDLEIATASVDQAAAQYGIVRSAQFPQVNAGVSAARERSSANAPLPGGRTVNDYGVNLSASFELDVWGKLRRATESARANLLATEQGKGTVVLTVVTTVATGYIQLRALDRQLQIAQDTSDSFSEVARLQRIRFEEGAVPESDYRQAESQYRDALAHVPELEREIARQENFISVLLGRNPGPIARGNDIDGFLFPAVPGALPAALLERRPDIRQAEQQLIAANADIGVAKAAYFPDISLTGLLGLESAQLSDLFKGPSRVWSFGAGVAQPIFNAGRIRAQVAQAEALQREALYTYQKAIISAFQDVENALIDQTKFGQVRTEQGRNVAALRRFRDLAELRYREGATIYLEVANAEQSLFNAELAYVATQAQLFQSYANLYRAMGGGWIEEAERLTSRQD
ncbi:MAG: efflux transporter outer membrane subunit [Betaproteobacteria bacterium]|nr:MAG: efflux transporter outer membrane subunit [Betaproteobacteria bacterium]